MLSRVIVGRLFLRQSVVWRPIVRFQSTTSGGGSGGISGENSIASGGTRKLIMSVCRDVDRSRGELLYGEFVRNTRHFSDDQRVDMTGLMNLYKWTGPFLFLSMNNHVYWDKQKFSRESQIDGIARAKETISRTPFVRMHNEIAIHNRFRYDLDGEQIIDVHPFDAAHGVGQFYRTVIMNLSHKIVYRHEVSIKYDHTKASIRRACNKVTQNRERRELLYTEFVNGSNHSFADTYVDITELMDKYHITGEELFLAMYYGSFQSAFVLGKNRVLSLKDAERVLKTHGYNIDYYDGRPIRNHFRDGVGKQQYILINRFDDRTHHGCFYECLLRILDKKLFGRPSLSIVL